MTIAQLTRRRAKPAIPALHKGDVLIGMHVVDGVAQVVELNMGQDGSMLIYKFPELYHLPVVETNAVYWPGVMMFAIAVVGFAFLCSWFVLWLSGVL